MISIQNNRMKCTVSELGAELQSVLVDGTEFLWQGDPNYWTGHAPIMFPMCGGLKEDRYEYNGVSYTLNKHGFAKSMMFTVIEQKEDSVTLVLRDNEETKTKYPFSFAFYVTFRLDENTLITEYTIENTDKEHPLYGAVGGHEAYACPQGLEAYDVLFNNGAPDKSRILEGNLLSPCNSTTLPAEGNKLSMRTEFFAVDALVFPEIASHEIALVAKDGSRRVDLSFEDFKHLLLWTKPGANYLCMEPWDGLPDLVGSNFDFTQKASIKKVNAGEKCTYTHKATFSLGNN